MKTLWPIAGLAARQILRRKMLIPIGVIAVFVLVSEISTMHFMRYAQEADEKEMAESLAYQLPGMVHGTFTGIGFVLAFVLGISVARQEIRERTILTMLSRPVGRGQYLLGRWIGLAIFLMVYSSAVAITTSVIAFYAKVGPTAAYPAALVLDSVALLVLATVAFCAGTVAGPPPAGALTLLVALMPSLLHRATESNATFMRWPARAVDLMLPHWDAFGQSEDLFKRGSVMHDWATQCWAFGYGATYVALLLILSVWLFRHVSLVSTET